MASHEDNRDVIVGIESGGTKLQVAVALRDRPTEFLRCVREPIDRKRGAEGILKQLEQILGELTREFSIRAIGYGFGGPVEAGTGRVITSHQVEGWDDFPLAEWFHQKWSVPLRIGNDCNVAALAEAHHGAGQGHHRVLYVTVGTGIGGGMVIDGEIDGEQAPAVAEIGHLRPGLDALDSQQTVESIASGLGIETRAVAAIESPGDWNVEPSEARALSAGNDHGTSTEAARITAQQIYARANEGNPLAKALAERATQTLGWAIAQATTLLAPECVVIGGGVALGNPSFIPRVCEWWERYCFAPHRNVTQILPAGLGEHVVLIGALELATRAGA